MQDLERRIGRLERLRWVLVALAVLIVGLMALAFIAASRGDDDFATIAWAGEAVKDTNGDGVLSGRELTIEDWIRCRDQNNADNEASGSGAPELTALPSLIDGEWRFAGVLGGEFYSCQGMGR